MIVSNQQGVSIHTRTGVQLYQYLPSKVSSGSWTRDVQDVSTLTLELPADDVLDKLDIIPWLHWVSVWDMEASGQRDALLWKGPIQTLSLNRRSGTLNVVAKDLMAFMKRTRAPLSKKWDSADPATIAGELVQDMLELHGITETPIIRLDPYGSRFEYTAESDTKMLNEQLDDLVRLGLRWTVVSGVPILGPAHRNPITVLGEEHFLGDGLTITRDGSSSYNNILLRGADAIAHAKVPMAGLDLQTIVTVDDVHSVSNAERAAFQAARYYASIRDSVSLPGGTVLHPDAPITMRQMIPSVRVNIDAYGSLYGMELHNVTVTMGGGNADTTVAVSLEVTTDDLPELSTINGQQPNVSSSSGVAGSGT